MKRAARLAVRRLGLLPSAALATATAYGVLLIAGAFLAPVYATTTNGAPHGGTVSGSTTLVGVNGLRVVAVVAVPLLVTLAVAGALWLRSRRGAGAVAWSLTGLLALFNLLALLSIGVFVLPVTAALIVACVAGHPGRRRTAGIG